MYFNIEANGLLLEPNISFTYDNEQPWGNWIFSSDYNYFYGWTFAEGDASKGARPKGWEIGNTIKTYFTLYDARDHAESLYLKALRVDIGGILNHRWVLTIIMNLAWGYYLTQQNFFY